MHERIRHAREQQGYTRERFAEKLDVSVSYLAELERGRTGISVKMLVKICGLLGLSADYVLFGEERSDDAILADNVRQIDDQYLPLLNKVISELLILNKKEEGKMNTQQDDGFPQLGRLSVLYRFPDK